MKRIAVIGCLDTKQDEVMYLSDSITKKGIGCIVIDVSLREHESRDLADISAGTILETNDYALDSLSRANKSEALSIMCDCLPSIMRKLWQQGSICGVIAAGGLQNSLIAKSAMTVLPFGFPKVLISSMACGLLDFERIIGRSDICIFPAVADVAGINPISKVVFDNAISAVIGMASSGDTIFQKNASDRIIGITCAGVTAKGATLASELLKRRGYKTCFFHGATLGGLVMEDFIADGVIEGVLDLFIHDILTEAIGYHVYTMSKDRRLERLAAAKIPAVISLSGMDVIDIPQYSFKSSVMPDKENRRIFYHNPTTLHVKATKDEILKGGRLLLRRLENFQRPITMVMAKGGFRANTRIGEELYDPEVDNALLELIRSNVQSRIKLVEVEANANDAVYSETVANEYLALVE